MLKHLNNTWKSTDSIQLITLANLCPPVAGSIVYEARALYNRIYGYQYTVFCDNNCVITPNGFRKPQNISENSNIFDVVLYPNPNGGNFYIKANQNVEIPLIIYIYDTKGKLVATQQCVQSRIDCNINVLLPTGLYIVKITNKNSNETVVKKMEIQ